MELLEAVRGGNAPAYGTLYQRHAVAARALACQLIQDDEEVEDVLVETFAGILDLVRSGEGPVFAFRPHLLMAVRRFVAIGVVDLTDPDAVYVDPELTGLERTVLARAFFSLPERWRMVLWHADVEGARPGDIAPLLGMSAGGVGALADRAREGLRQAYLQLHREGGPGEECGPILSNIIGYVEGGLHRREAHVVDEHVAECIDCRAVFLELADLSQQLKVIVGQLVAGPHIDGYLAELKRAGETTSSPALGPAAVLRRVPVSRRALATGVAVTVAIAGFVLISEPLSDEGPVPRHPEANGRPSPPKPAVIPKPAGSPTPAGSPKPAMSPGAPLASAPAPVPRAAPSPRKDKALGGEVPVARPSSQASRPPARVGRAPDAGTPSRLSAPVARHPADRHGRGSHGQDPSGPDPSGPDLSGSDLSGSDQSGSDQSGSDQSGSTLAASIDPLGSLVRARSGIVGVRLRNTGRTETRNLLAAVTLPQGVVFTAGGALAAAAPVGTVDGWACHTEGRVVTCSRGALAPGAATTIFLPVLVAAHAPKGGGLALRVRSGGQVVSARSTTGVRASGATARFAADGRVTTRAVGNTLLSSSPMSPGCAATTAHPATGRLATPVDLDTDATTRSSSCATLDLPAGGQVLWAGLYWSATGRGTTPVSSIRVRAPGAASYTWVHAAEVAGSDLPIQHGYQAFADVTSLVRGAGGGRWWAADPSMRWGASHRAGWSLVVLATDRSRPYSRAAVLDTAAVVGRGGEPLKVPLAGLAPAAVPARIDVVVWKPDGAEDGSMALADRASPTGGGAAGEMRGVVVETLHTVLGRRAVLRLRARKSSLLFGVVAVSARSWS
ncbi:hypothetical protein GCM10023193_75980 [Planotetraspora kaengkrachanensis]|uniref:RNA polymerase sigma factor, sigma-70 family n=1 Tax=Planotetraspora kaengkrachanensis TaxID=575193 RepID=A0A8J3M235_9ACTN|nr:hypothetical protein Pka01_39150 [Planotetraspora kaengkrachanensis]